MRVVVIDNRMRIRHELVGMLVEMKHEAVGCADSEAALQAIQAGDQDPVVIAGEVRGFADGLEVCRSLRSHSEASGCPILVLTTSDALIDAADLVKAGGTDTIAFPVTEAKLEMALDTVQREAEHRSDPVEAGRRLKKPAELLIQMFEQAPDGYFLADAGGNVLAGNRALCQLTGYSEQELADTTLSDLGLVFDTKDGDSSPATGTITSRSAELTLLTKSRQHHAVELQTFDVQIVRHPCTLGVVRDTSGQAQHLKQHADDIIAALSENVSDVVWLLTPEGLVRFVSPSVEPVLGYQAADLIGSPIQDLIHPDDLARVEASISGERENDEMAGGQTIRVQHSDGSWQALAISASDLSSNPAVEGMLLTLKAPHSPSTSMMISSSYAGFDALYDPVTALPSRTLFLDRLDHALERATRFQQMIGLLVIDLARLEAVQEDRDEAAVNRLLEEFSERLHRCIRSGDTAARLGEHEFAVLADGVRGETDTRSIADRLHARLQTPFRHAGRDIELAASVGIALSNPRGQNAGNLLRDAHAAMSAARAQGDGHTVTFQQSMRQNVLNTLRTDMDLHGALERGELQLHYQPEVDLTTGTIVGIETLVRWEHPHHGLILPGEFITIAEESGLIVPIGQWVLEQACRQAHAWRARYQTAQAMVISVNMSPVQLRQPEFVEQVAGTLLRERLHPANLRVELPGHLLASNEPAVTGALQALRDLGVHLAVQDVDSTSWETGQLDHVPADTLKIDRSFVGRLMPKRQHASPGQPSGPNIVVSGIETAQHLARARIYKHKSGQGFYFSQPVPGRAIDELLSRGTGPVATGRIVQDIPLLESA